MIATKPPRCKHCKARTEAIGKALHDDCVSPWYEANKQRLAARKAKAERVTTRARKEALKPRAKWLAECQAIVNKIVRLRDRDKPCCSCDRPATWDGQWHASHFRSVGAAPGIRFHLWNIEKGCSICNNHLSGNLAGYIPRKVARDGQEPLPEVLQILPNLRVPHLNGCKFKYRGNDKHKGYDFEFDYGLGDEESNISFPDCAAGKYEIEVKEGGTCVLRWQVSYAGERLTDEALVKLIRHEQKQAFITLKAPAVLVLVKGGKAKAAAPAADGESGSLLDEDDENDELDPESAEGAFAATAG